MVRLYHLFYYNFNIIIFELQLNINSMNKMKRKIINKSQSWGRKDIKETSVVIKKGCNDNMNKYNRKKKKSSFLLMWWIDSNWHF